MNRRLILILALSAAPFAGCGALIGVEPLSGDDAAPDEAGDAPAVEVGEDAPAAEAGQDAATVDAPTECSVVWVGAEGGIVPPGAVNAEPLGDAGLGIFVCHVSVASGVTCGKLLPNYGCYYGDVDGEVLSGDYQALVPTGCTVAWKASPTGVVPAGSVPCGQDPQGVLYSCRVEQPVDFVGELGHMGWGTNHECVYSYGGATYSTTSFDVLTLY
jgi:hypothetical protein